MDCDRKPSNQVVCILVIVKTQEKRGKRVKFSSKIKLPYKLLAYIRRFLLLWLYNQTKKQKQIQQVVVQYPINIPSCDDDNSKISQLSLKKKNGQTKTKPNQMELTTKKKKKKKKKKKIKM